jgi:acetamidase/formamidase
MAVYHFQPTGYHMTFGSHQPVLRIASGDTVVTTTVDAEGVDARKQRVAAKPNPQTGPFYVEDAQPGDTLFVHLDHLYPNRDYGYSYTAVAPNVVDPSYVWQLPERKRVEWRIDLTGGTATLMHPVGRLADLSLPLAPMLGCLGVAPAGGQAISSSTSGKHGGNMDYHGLVAGVGVYLPVFVPGALIHLGDGHAIQGHGELVGAGIEVSFDVQFTVRVFKSKTIQWPRGENDEYVFTIGNARPLDQAVQHATTEMLRWLQEDHGLDALSAHTLLGQCVEYDLGNIFDPAYTMVCKVPRRLLTAAPNSSL